MQLELLTDIAKLDEITIKYGTLFFLWALYLWELYLLNRQYNEVKRTKEVPPEFKHFLKQETFEEARLYTLEKIQFIYIQDTFSIIISTIVICFNILSLIWEYTTTIPHVNGEILTSCVWLVTLSTLSTIIKLPLMIYYTFVLEEKYGYNYQTIGFFIWDQIKTLITNQILISIISPLVIVTIKKGGDYLFVWLWLIVGEIALIATTIYPSMIAPLFDILTPLPEGELRIQIEILASELDFPLAQVYVVEGPKRSSHSNAYLFGFFKTKSIVLFDRLLPLNDDDERGCTNYEILAIVAHELGHWYYNHFTKNLILTQIILFLLFAMFSFLFKHPPVYHAFGFYKEQPVLVGLIIVIQYIMMPYYTVMGALRSYFSRKFEFEADTFAVYIYEAEPLIDALIQLALDNFSFPIWDPLYSAWHHDHPPLLQRIDAIKKQAHID